MQEEIMRRPKKIFRGETYQAECLVLGTAAAPVDGLGPPLGIELGRLVGVGTSGVARRLEDGDAVHGADGLRLDVVAEAAARARREGAAVVRVHPDHCPRRTRHEEHTEECRAPEEEVLQLDIGEDCP